MITKIDPRTALILIDLQTLVVNLPTAHPIKNVLDKCAALVAAFRKAGLPIVVVNVNPDGAAWTKTRKDSVMRQQGELPANWLDIAPEIITQPDDIFITKHTWSAFYETALEEELKKREITGIVIAGIATSIGVEGTARAASERAYNIAFASDAMTDMVAAAHENSLKYIFPRMGEVDSTANIIAAIERL